MNAFDKSRVTVVSFYEENKFRRVFKPSNSPDTAFTVSRKEVEVRALSEDRGLRNELRGKRPIWCVKKIVEHSGINILKYRKRSPSSAS